MSTYDRRKWTRRRENWRLARLVNLPVYMAKQTNDPWSYDEQRRQFIFTTNPVWEAACDELERLGDLYGRKVPLAQWDITVPGPHDEFWGPFGDPTFRANNTGRGRRIRHTLDSPDSFSLQAGQDELDSWANFVRELRSKKV